MESLIQQRIAVERERISALVLLASAVPLLLLGCVLLAFDPGRWYSWLTTAGWVVLCLIAAARYIRARRRIRAFEAAHGKDAGRQRPV
ncbi:hypothetical protein [Microbacterium sp. JZ31]|uniref:hypothetical protein n=1 Tax=Microbacterium sp. JZ31 TaxID=1906274 RepID=UPI0019340801|nr:hypothetical protein [Microbacterium sp. JZ31]